MEPNYSTTLARDRGLGWQPGPVDPEDYQLEDYLTVVDERVGLEESGVKYWANTLHLDQGKEGACVGFGGTQMYNAAPFQHRKNNAYAFSLYHEAQRNDPWPGENYEGTTVRAGMDTLLKWGLIREYAFESRVENMLLWVLNQGPLVIGVDWMEGMDGPTLANGYFITPTGRVRGGHCCIVDGVLIRNLPTDFVRIKNSWGARWGQTSRCYMLVTDFARLMARRNAAAATSVEPLRAA